MSCDRTVALFSGRVGGELRFTRVSLQARLAQAGRPALVLCEDFTFRANRPEHHIQTELWVKPENVRGLWPRGIVAAEFHIVNSETKVGPKNIGMKSQEIFVSANRVLIPS